MTKHALIAFVGHLLDHWLWLLGLVLMIEPVADYLFEGFRAWADKKIPRKARTRVAVTVSISCILVACFLAFYDEYKDNNDLRNQINGKAGYVQQVAQLKEQNNLLLSNYNNKDAQFSAIKILEEENAKRSIYMPSQPTVVTPQGPFKKTDAQVGKEMVGVASAIAHFMAVRAAGQPSIIENKVAEKVAYDNSTLALYRQQFSSDVLRLRDEAKERGYISADLNRYADEFIVVPMVIDAISTDLGVLGKKMIDNDQ